MPRPLQHPDLPGTDLGRPGRSEGAVPASEAGSSRSRLPTERQLRLRALPQAFCRYRVGGTHSRHRSPWTQLPADRWPSSGAAQNDRCDSDCPSQFSCCLEAFRNVEGKRVIPVGLASLYAIQCLEPTAQPPAGSLFFRCHSTGVTQLKLDDDQLIRNLRGLPDRFHPIRICAYWRDWDLGEYEPFLAEGFQVVGAGPYTDPLFIWRHLHLLRSHRYVLSTGVSSHVFHACLMGRPTLILPMLATGDPSSEFCLEGPDVSGDACIAVALPGGTQRTQPRSNSPVGVVLGSLIRGAQRNQADSQLLRPQAPSPEL